MASGIPVLVNDWVVMKEITDQGSLAALYGTRDVEDCLSKLDDLTDHLDERKAMAKKVAGIVRRRFSIENHLDNLNKVYHSLQG